MRRLIVWNLMTLDGFFEGPKSWDLDWHDYVWGPELERLSIEQLHSADLLLFGRVTYEGMAAYWATATGEVADLMNGIGKIVFSSTLERAAWSHTRLVKTRAEDEVARLKQGGSGKDIFIFGSAVLCDGLARAGLIDEIRLCLVPVVLGGGHPLFKPNPSRMKMTLLEARALESGGVILRYRPAGA